MCFHLGKNTQVQVRMCQVQVQVHRSQIQVHRSQVQVQKNGNESDSSPSPGLEYYISVRNDAITFNQPRPRLNEKAQFIRLLAKLTLISLFKAVIIQRSSVQPGSIL